jgi:hypothetical protein
MSFYKWKTRKNKGLGRAVVFIQLNHVMRGESMARLDFSLAREGCVAAWTRGMR